MSIPPVHPLVLTALVVRHGANFTQAGAAWLHARWLPWLLIPVWAIALALYARSRSRR